MAKNQISGRCFCGTICFRLEPPLDFCGHCHCESCRRSHAAAFVTWTSVPEIRFAVLRGRENIKWYRSSEWIEWGFCGNCGSSMFYKAIKEGHPDSPDTSRMYIAVGSLGPDFEGSPTVHVSWEEKARWLAMTDNLPKLIGKTEVQGT